MSNLEWDEGMQREWLRLKAEIANKNFRPLSIGIGLGHLRPLSQVETEPSIPGIDQQALASAHTPQSSQDLTAWQEGGALFKKSKSTAAAKPAAMLGYSPEKSMVAESEQLSHQFQKRPTSRSKYEHLFYKYVKSHLIDMLFVILTLFMAASGFALVVEGKPLAWNLQALRDWLPMQWLVELEPIYLLLGIYGVYLMYWLFFKLVLGSTLGQSLTNVAAGGDRKFKSR